MENTLPQSINKIEPEKSTDTIEPLSINDFTTFFNKINAEFIKAMNKVDEIVLKNNVSDADIKYLKELNICFQVCKLDYLAYESYGFGIHKTLLQATLSDSYNRSLILFNDKYDETWKDKVNEYKIKFIQIGFETEFLLDFIIKLKNNLDILSEYYQVHVIREIFIPLDEYFDISRVSDIAEKEPDLLKRKQIYVTSIVDVDLLCIHNEIEPRNEKLHQTFIQKCRAIIDLLDFQIENTPVTTSDHNIENSVDESIKSKDFTTKRQVLALHYLLNEVGSKTGSVDRTVQARFIEFMTGKNYTSIYKALSDPLKGLDNTKNISTIEDMEYVRNQFDKLGLENITNKIKGDMNI